MHTGEERNCPDCQRRTYGSFSRVCGVWVCSECEYHWGLARCFCGWNLAPGERLEDDIEL